MCQCYLFPGFEFKPYFFVQGGFSYQLDLYYYSDISSMTLVIPRCTTPHPYFYLWVFSPGSILVNTSSIFLFALRFHSITCLFQSHQLQMHSYTYLFDSLPTIPILLLTSLILFLEALDRILNISQ